MKPIKAKSHNHLTTRPVNLRPKEQEDNEPTVIDSVMRSHPEENTSPTPSLPRRLGLGIANFAGRLAKDSLSHTAMALAIPAATFAVSLVAPVAAPAVAVGLGASVGIAHLLTSPKYKAPSNAPALTERKYKDAALGKAILAGTTTTLLAGIGAGAFGAVLPFLGIGGAALATGGAIYGAVKSVKDQAGEGLQKLGLLKNYKSQRTVDWLVLDRKPQLNKEGYYDGDFFFP